MTTTTPKPMEKLFPDSPRRRNSVRHAVSIKTKGFKDLSNEGLISLGKYLETGFADKLTPELQKIRKQFVAGRGHR